MNVLASDWYRNMAASSFESGKNGRVLYFMANHALDELIDKTMEGHEPTDDNIDALIARFDIAAKENSSADEFMGFRAKFIRSYMRPIVWSGVINIDGLNDRQAKRVNDTIDLPGSLDQSALVLAEALALYDKLDSLPRDERQGFDTVIGETVGAISEGTLLSVVNRPSTAKMMALPSTAYVDWSGTPRVDGYVYDNRKKRTEPIFPYQVKSVGGNVAPSAQDPVPVVGARVMGNLPKQSLWPYDDRPFMTARMVVEERIGGGIVKSDASRLDKVGSSLLNFITNKRSSS
jgi:hypothetical protein